MKENNSILELSPPQFFEVLSDNIREHYGEECAKVLDYFEENYMGGFRRNAPRRVPLFSIDLWNMFHRCFDELPRTNNNIEGWHRGFKSSVRVDHPTFWKLVDALKKEQSLSRVHLMQACGGHPPPPVRRRYVDVNQRLLNLVDNFPNYEPIRYLRTVAYNLGLHW